MRKLLIALAMILSLAASAAPRLVVGIYIEGLSADDLNALSSSMGAMGFNKALKSGRVISHLDYGESRGAAAVAMLLTGATPSVNGIAAPRVYDRESGRSLSVFHDPAYMGNFTSETYSPVALRVSTLADEMRIASDGASRVYSIAPWPETAIITGGHAASSAVWINSADGRWSTSTYYKDTPKLVTETNYRAPLSQRLDTITWAGKGFKYTFPRSSHDRYEMLRLSPRVNEEVTALAIEYVDHIARTADPSAPDMLNVAYTLAEYPHGSAASTIAAERVQAYRSLDSQLSKLLMTIDAKIGLMNAVVFIAGIPATGYTRGVEAKWGIPTGDFSPRKATALLNMYLMAVHGNGDWVSGYHRRHFYLNDKLADERGVDIKALRRESAEFLQRMSGITDAETLDDIMRSDRRRYIDVATAGDVIISITPGWSETDDDNAPGKAMRATPSTAPFMLLAPGIKPLAIDRADATTIAAALASAIGIQAPNAAN